MKITFLLIICLFSLISTASSQYYYGIVWEKSLTSDFGVPDEYIGTSFYFTCMDCLDKNNCIVTGIVNKYPNIQDPGKPRYERITMRTDNGGQSWRIEKLSTDIEKSYNIREAIPYLRSIIMVDSLVAIAVGDSGRVIRTTDAGMNWNRITNAAPPTHNAVFRSIAFSPNRQIGMAVGGKGIVSMTTDSGTTWNTRELLLYPTLNSTVLSPANNVFYIFDEFYNKMFRTFNAGQTWDTLTIYKNPLTSKIIIADSENQGNVVTAHFITPAVGWLTASERHKENLPNDITHYRVLSQTNDSGKTWRVKRSEYGTIYDTYNTISFADVENGIIGGSFGFSLFTADTGYSWYEGPRFSTYNHPSIIAAQYKDPNQGLVIFMNGSATDCQIYRFRRVPLSVDEVQGWGSNPYFWVQTAPCPAVSTVRARLFGLYSIKTREVTAKVYDMMGNVVYDASREATDGNNGAWSDLTFSVEGWAPGVYLLGMQAEGAGFARAFVVSR